MIGDSSQKGRNANQDMETHYQSSQDSMLMAEERDALNTSGVGDDDPPPPQTGSEHAKTENEQPQQQHDSELPTQNGFCARQAKRVARYSQLYFWTSLIISFTLGVIGMVGGDFRVAANNNGWSSRGTLIADRETQLLLVRYHRFELFEGPDKVWYDLIHNVQPGWQTDNDDDNDNDDAAAGDDDDDRRVLSLQEPFTNATHSTLVDRISLRPSPLSTTMKGERNMPFYLNANMTRRLQAQNGAGILDGCDIRWYISESMTQERHLWPIWKTQQSDQTALDPAVIRDLCIAEETTQQYLIDKGLCIPCDGGGCLPPYSLVLYVRIRVPKGFYMDCETLSVAWGDYQEKTEARWPQCVEDVKYYAPNADKFEIPGSCPFGFFPTLLDDEFDSTGRIEYTSSIFATIDNADALFENVGGYDRGSNLITGAYDTQYEDFVFLQINDSLVNDLVLAMGSALVTALAILVHTRSPFLTLVGLVQILLSFPLAYFVYTFVAQLDFFPFLNFIGVFVAFALGADDVFVAVDKWKNARIQYYDASTEYVAAVALPDAAGAMFLTTITTAVAFFGTAICPVAPIKCFAVFCGLLVIFDYVMCVLLLFPALCMYDRTRNQTNSCMRCHCCNRCETHGPHGEEDEDKPSLIHRILLNFYNVLHRLRWPTFALCLAALGISAYFASQLDLPETSDVRLLKAEDFQYELAYEWRFHLLYDVLITDKGSQAFVIWGTKPADTGDHNNPETWSQLVLDDSFDPSTEEAQMYMAGFCDKLFEQEFAEKIDPYYKCPMNEFDSWLQEQSKSDDPDESYVPNCGGATALPVAQENFHDCIIAWSKDVDEITVLALNGVVRIMYVKFNTRVRYDSPYNDLDNEWHAIERWMKNERDHFAPVEVRRFYHSSLDFWWYDTNGQMLRTAYGAAAIALAMAAAVILLSSRSFVLTIFAVCTIGFILISVTALLVGLGWTLGFLESICFAILIGISCDFVIHFTHAYATLPGKVSRGDRTKFALLRMGPSILAAAFTTIAAAIIMLFCTITFFEKFALILFLTILMATIGSFVVFITMADCIGPSQPTWLVDKMIAKCTYCFRKCHCNRRNHRKSAIESSTKNPNTSEEGSNSDVTS